MRVRVPVMAGAILALATFGGCTGGSGPAATPTPGSQAVSCGVASGGTPMQIKNFAFNPASLTVSVGGEVDWTNGDGGSHTVTFDAGPDCGTVAGGGSIGATFAVAGEYKYHCNIHRSMTGTVIVE